MSSPSPVDPLVLFPLRTTPGPSKPNPASSTTSSERSSPSETADADVDLLPASDTPSHAAVMHVSGGSASFAVDDDELRVLRATPRPGYGVGLRFEGPAALVLTFTSTRDLSTIAVAIGESGILVDSSETRR
jgi:hypothetical protein